MASSFPAHDVSEGSVTLPSDGRIAYVEHGKIATINADGSDRDVLVAAGENSGPSWSPDGTRIAYVHEDAAGKADLWIMNADGTGRTRITTDAIVLAATPGWSPDGTQLSFGASCIATEGSPDLCQWTSGPVLTVVNTSKPYGTARTIVSHAGGELGQEGPIPIDGRSSWALSGQSIAFYTNRLDFGGADQWIVEYQLSDETLDAIMGIGAAGTYGTLGSPTFSPDGSLLAYDEYYYEQGPRVHRGIQVREVNGPGIDLFRQVKNDTQLAFAPSQTRVALVRHVKPHDRILLADLDGTNRSALVRGSQPSWQRTY